MYSAHSKSIASRLLNNSARMANGAFASWIANYIAGKFGRAELVQICDVARYIADSNGEPFYRVLNRELTQTISAMGYSVKKREFRFDRLRADWSDEEKQMLDNIEYLYLEQDMTAREVCEFLNINYSSKMQKLFCLCFPKQKGRGGARKGAGRKSY